MKDVPIPSKFQYEKALVDKTEDFLNRVRWKLYVVKNPDKFTTKYETFGFPSPNKAPADRDLFKFEEKVMNLVSSIKYKPINNEFQKDLRREIREIQESDKITIFADKTRNYYKLPIDDYKRFMSNSITQDYKKCPSNKVDLVNREAAKLTQNFPTGKITMKLLSHL